MSGWLSAARFQLARRAVMSHPDDPQNTPSAVSCHQFVGHQFVGHQFVATSLVRSSSHALAAAAGSTPSSSDPDVVGVGSCPASRPARDRRDQHTPPPTVPFVRTFPADKRDVC